MISKVSDKRSIQIIIVLLFLHHNISCRFSFALESPPSLSQFQEVSISYVQVHK